MENININEIIDLCKKAGEETLKIYKDEIDFVDKGNDSPVTAADLRSNEILTEGLKKYGYPIISEEYEDNPAEESSSSEYLWIIDPLDGTKDFIQKTDDFSIMVALVRQGKPILGFVHAPALNKTYYAKFGEGAFVIQKGGEKKLSIDSESIFNQAKMVISRNHFKQEDKDVALRLGVENYHTAGSVGIKFCLIAEGKANLCIYSTGFLGIWDCAAPHIILKEAGGEVYDIHGNEPSYKPSDLRMRTGFIGTSDMDKDLILQSIKTNSKGAVLWFTGLSGAGKSTVANAVYMDLKKKGVNVELLDGDEVRKNLTAGLGFKKEDRDENIKRISYVAKLLSRNNVIVLAAFISPYKEMRDHVRRACNNFAEVYVSAPLEVCEKRDIKGLYKRARSGDIPNFTGISDPYEIPENPEIELKTHEETIEESASKVLEYLKQFNGDIK